MKKLILIPALCALSLWGDDPPLPFEKMQTDNSVIFLLEPGKSSFTDVSGHFSESDITVSNGTVEQENGVSYLRFGEKPGCVTIRDDGKINYPDGFTVEAWVYFEKAPEDDLGFMEKSASDWFQRSIHLAIRKNMVLTLHYLGLYGEKINASLPSKKNRPYGVRDYYPGHTNTMNGLLPFPPGKWTHLAFSYDRKTRIRRTWVDFGIDRSARNPWYEIASEVTDDDKYALVLFKKAKNLRVAQVRFSDRGREIGNVPPVHILVEENTYRKKTFLDLSMFSEKFPLPATVSVLNGGNSAVLGTITSRDDRNFEIPRGPYGNASSTLLVRFHHKGKEFYRYLTNLGNPEIENPHTWHFLRTGEWTPRGPRYPDWRIHEDNSFSWKGKKLFPLSVYFVTPEEMESIAALGFNMFSLIDAQAKPNRAEWLKKMPEFHRKAEKLGVFIIREREMENLPAQGFPGIFDEPWGFDTDFVRQKFLMLRNARERVSTLPLTGAQNNPARYREISCGMDIVSIDPYPIHGRMPLRYIYDCTRMAIRETYGRKPVQVVIENYGGEEWRPTFHEFRTSVYLALEGGASALSFFAWHGWTQKTKNLSSSDLPETVESYRRVLREIRSLEPYFVTPNLASGPTFEPASPRGFFGAAKKLSGKTLLMISSDFYTQEERTVVFPDAGNGSAKLLFPENTPGVSDLVFQNGKASLTLPPLTSACFLLDSPTGGITDGTEGKE